MKESIFVILIILLAYSLSTSESYGNDEICYSDNLTTYNISHNGNIRVADDDQSIVSISPGGYLRFSAKTFGNQRRIEIESGSGGNLTCKYFEENREIPFEPEGKKWLGEVLIHVIRASGIDADNRAVRIYKKSGLNGFFDEIMQISSNSVKDLYFSALLSNQKLPEEELALTYQSVLKHHDQQLIPLNAELELVESYGYLMSVRYVKAMEISVDVDKGMNGKLVPPLSVQMLVENAIKHNQLSHENPLRIEIYSEDDYLFVRNNFIGQPKYLKIQDNLVENPVQAGSHQIGLENIKRRYFYLTNQRIVIGKNSFFIVGIPLLKPIDEG